MTIQAQTGQCCKCSRHGMLLYPLHGDKGGPLLCLTCGSDWHVDQKRQERNQTLIRRLQFGEIFGEESIPELHKELLSEILQLTHPDRHPPERKEFAERVTAELTKLKPFVFPKRSRPKYEEPLKPPPQLTKEEAEKKAERERWLDENMYPCKLCKDIIPTYYCDRCKDRHEKEWEAKAEHQREQEKRWRENAKRRRELLRRPVQCIQCGTDFKGKRKDAKFCSPACRQKAHRQTVTANKRDASDPIKSRNDTALQIKLGALSDPRSSCNKVLS